MLTIDLSQFNTYILVLMPVIAAFVAGIIRQDKFPPRANEIITLLVILALAILQAALNGKIIFDNPIATFGFVAAYATALVHSPLGTSFQQGVQSNVLSLGKPAPAQVTPPTMPTVTIDVNRLAQLLIAELGKPNVPAPPPIESMPTQTGLQAVRTNTPAQGG